MTTKLDLEYGFADCLFRHVRKRKLSDDTKVLVLSMTIKRLFFLCNQLNQYINVLRCITPSIL